MNSSKPAPSLRARLRRRRHLFLRRPPVTLEEFLAVLARLYSGQPGGIWLVAHPPFSENAVEVPGIETIFGAEVHSLGDPRPVLRVVRRFWHRQAGPLGRQRQRRIVENRRGGGCEAPQMRRAHV